MKESVEKVKKYKGSIRGMNRRVEKATNEVKELEYRLKNAINKNDDVAGAKIATDLANAQDILQDATKIRDDATADYENNLRIIRESEDAIADAQKRCLCNGKKTGVAYNEIKR
jgi:molecular chaperone GrpE (heat shock protein)